MNGVSRFALRTIYYVAWWGIVTGLCLLAVAVPFMVSQDVRLDDDVIWLAGIPAGLLIFVPVARWALGFLRLHACFLAIGGMGVVAVVPLGILLLRRSSALTGVGGPFAGAGELVTAFFCFLAGLFFVAIIAAGATGIGMARDSRTRARQPPAHGPARGR